MITARCGAACSCGLWIVLQRSELQAAFAGRFGEGLDAAVVTVARAVESDGFDTRRTRLLGDGAANLGGRVLVLVAGEAGANIRFERGRRSQHRGAIRAEDLGDAQTGDAVLIRLINRGKRPGRPLNAKIVEVTERATRVFVGTYFEADDKGFVRVDGTAIRDPISVGDPGAKGARPETADCVERLMGNRPEARFVFIQERAAFAAELIDI